MRKEASAPKNASQKRKNASTNSILPAHRKTAANVNQKLLAVGI